MKLLKKLCSIHAPSGEENNISEFIIEYVNSNMQNWKVKPKIYSGEGFQDCIILKFGNPKTAIFAHMDSIGFTVKYSNELVKIGGPVTDEGINLVGEDSKGKIDGKLIKKKEKLFIEFDREIDRGTSLTFKMNFVSSKDYILSLIHI